MGITWGSERLARNMLFVPIMSAKTKKKKKPALASGLL
jgi:hypothetical protein